MKNMRNLHLILFLLAVILASGCVEQPFPPVACTQDAMICPDGSAVGRVGPNCEFAPCPTPSESTSFVYYKPVQCQGNPWEVWFSENTGEDKCVGKPDGTIVPSGDSCNSCSCTNGVAACTLAFCEGEVPEEKTLTQYFLAEHEIQILEVRKIEADADAIVCRACSCPRGDTLSVLVNDNDLQKMTELGWKENSSDFEEPQNQFGFAEIKLGEAFLDSFYVMTIDNESVELTGSTFGDGSINVQKICEASDVELQEISDAVSSEYFLNLNPQDLVTENVEGYLGGKNFSVEYLDGTKKDFEVIGAEKKISDVQANQEFLGTWNKVYSIFQRCASAPDEVQCANDIECGEGYKCFNSQVCGLTPTDVQCGEQFGDLKCHKSCETDNDCPLEMPKCEDTEFWQGDAGTNYKICVAGYPTTQAQCTAANGFWKEHCGILQDCCNFKTTDFGEICTDSQQCEGKCIAQNPSDSSGTCSEWQNTFGCFNFFENGQLQAICVD